MSSNLNININLKVEPGSTLDGLLKTITRSLNLTVVEPMVEEKIRKAKEKKEQNSKKVFTVEEFLREFNQHTNVTGPVGNTGPSGPPLLVPTLKQEQEAVAVPSFTKPAYNVPKSKRKVEKPKKVISLVTGNAAFFPNGNTELELPTMQRRTLGALIRLDNKHPDAFHRPENIAVEAGYPANTPMSHMVTLLRRYGFIIEAASYARARGVAVGNSVAGYRILPQSERNKVITLIGSQTPISKAAQKQLGKLNS